jgi:hypothetical protein
VGAWHLLSSLLRQPASSLRPSVVARGFLIITIDLIAAQSSPTRLPRALRALAQQAVIPKAGLTLRTSWEPSPPGPSIVVLAGRATRVP